MIKRVGDIKGVYQKRVFLILTWSVCIMRLLRHTGRHIRGSRYLFVLEVYNGIDTKRVHAHLEKHLVALGEGRISELYGYPRAHRVLCVFETESALQAAVRRLCEHPAFTDQMRHQFAFSTLAELRTGFAACWRFLTPGHRTIFDSSPPVSSDCQIQQAVNRSTK